MEWYKQGAKYMMDNRFSYAQRGQISALLGRVAIYERRLSETDYREVMTRSQQKAIVILMRLNYDCSLEDVLEKGYEDVIVVQHERVNNALRQANYRKRQAIIKGDITRNVTCDITHDVTPPEKEVEIDKELEVLKTVANELATEFLDKISKAKNRKLVSTKKSTSQWMLKLLKNDMTPELIRLTIHWLCTVNEAKTEFKFDVQSGKSLYEKWDKLQSAMTVEEKPTKESREYDESNAPTARLI